VLPAVLTRHARSGDFFFFGFLSLMISTRVAGRIYRPQLTIAWRRPEFAMRRCPCTVELLVANWSGRPIHGLSWRMANLPPGWRIDSAGPSDLSIPPGATAVYELRLEVPRRGVFPLPEVEFLYSCPFNIHRLSVKVRAESHLTVAPRHSSAPTEIESNAIAQPAMEMQRALRRVLQDQEYIGNREYVPGMPVRRWDYASWARLARSIVREFAGSFDATAVLVLDTTLPAEHTVAEEPIEEIEDVLSLAASLSVFLNEHHCPTISIGAADEQFDANEREGDNQRWVLRTLAMFPSAATRGFDSLANRVLQSSWQPTVVVLITHRWDDQRESLYKEMLRRFPAALAVTARRSGDESTPPKLAERAFPHTYAEGRG
jgi:uncharacterized protein (DUF58 family)